MNLYWSTFKKYIELSGRATRKEYWTFVLINIVLGIVLSIIGRLIGLHDMLANIFHIVIFCPGIAVSIRRLHDIGKSSWILLILLIPIIGWIWFIILLFLDSQSGENKYGPNPKGIAAPQKV